MQKKSQGEYGNGTISEEEELAVTLPIEIFLTRLRQLDFATKSRDIHADIIKEKLMEDIKRLPLTSAPIRERIRDVDTALSVGFWKTKSIDQSEFLKTKIAPLLRYQANVGVEGASWTLIVEKLGLALLSNDRKEVERLRRDIVDRLMELPPSVREVREKISLRDQAVQPEFWRILTFDDVEMLASQFVSLMKFRERKSEPK